MSVLLRPKKYTEKLLISNQDKFWRECDMGFANLASLCRADVELVARCIKDENMGVILAQRWVRLAPDMKNLGIYKTRLEYILLRLLINFSQAKMY